MKANACNCENSIEITEEEILRLGKQPLTGRIQRRLWNEKKDELPLRISIGPTPAQNPEAFIQTFPVQAPLEDMRGYSIIISERGYDSLKRKGYIGTRQNISWKIHIFRKGYEGSWD